MAIKMCSVCKSRPASVVIIKQQNGMRTELNLCDFCNKARQDAQTASYEQALAGALTSLFAGLGTQVRECSYCKTNIEEVSKRGLVGCQHCYTEFSDVLLPMIKQTQYTLTHVGKAPSSAPKSFASPAQEIEYLRQEIRRLADQERYLECAKLQSRIKELEEQA